MLLLAWRREAGPGANGGLRLWGSDPALILLWGIGEGFVTGL